MIKSTLIANMAAKLTNMPEQQVANVVNYILECMSDALANGQRIEIRGFGSFTSTYRPEHSAHNPKTGEQVIAAAKYTAHFKPGKELRERVKSS